MLLVHAGWRGLRIKWELKPRGSVVSHAARQPSPEAEITGGLSVYRRPAAALPELPGIERPHPDFLTPLDYTSPSPGSAWHCRRPAAFPWIYPHRYTKAVLFNWKNNGGVPPLSALARSAPPSSFPAVGGHFCGKLLLSPWQHLPGSSYREGADPGRRAAAMAVLHAPLCSLPVFNAPLLLSQDSARPLHHGGGRGS